MSEEVLDKKQKLMIEYLVSTPEVFTKCYSITKPIYFDSPLDRVIEFILEYFTKHGGLPNLDVIDAEVGVLLKERTLDLKSDMDYFLEEYESFCRDSAMAKAILEGVDLVNEGRSHEVEALVREAMLVKLDKHIGISLFHDPETRIRLMDERVINYSTGIKSVDLMIGYVRKGEFHMVYAPSSGGKSLVLANNAIAFAKQGLTVSIVSLELNEDLYAKRMDSMVSGEDISHHKDLAKVIADKMAKEKEEMADILIKSMPQGTTPSQLRAYLLEYSLENGGYPDVFIVDYLGIMGVDLTKSDNKFDKDDEKSQQLRRMAQEFDMITMSAGQINREGTDVLSVNAGHVAGGISVINNSDSSIALVASEEDIENNQVQVKQLKIRNANKSSKPVILYRCPKTLRFSDSPNVKTTNLAKPSYIKKSADKEESPKSSNGKDKLKKALSKR